MKIEIEGQQAGIEALLSFEYKEGEGVLIRSAQVRTVGSFRQIFFLGKEPSCSS